MVLILSQKIREVSLRVANSWYVRNTHTKFRAGPTSRRFKGNANNTPLWPKVPETDESMAYSTDNGRLIIFLLHRLSVLQLLDSEEVRKSLGKQWFSCFFNWLRYGREYCCSWWKILWNSFVKNLTIQYHDEEYSAV